MSITIRRLALTDIAALERIAPQVFDHPIHPRWAAEFLADPRHHLVVAIEGDLIVGMVSAVHYVHPDKAPELWINEIGVTPTHKRQGIARRMLQALLTHGRTLGCKTAWLLTEPDNAAARSLYMASGGAETPQIMVAFALDDRA